MVKEIRVDILGASSESGDRKESPFGLNTLARPEGVRVRFGFGQEREHDTMMSMPISVGNDTAQWGLVEPLGSKAIVTDFGHEQVVSIWLARVQTGSYEARTHIQHVFLVEVDDITTGEHYETPLYRHTSKWQPEGSSVLDMQGHWHTDQEHDKTAWVSASRSPFFFFESFDILYFGSPMAGLWAYRPSSFRGRRFMQVDAVHRHDWAPPYEESAVVIPVVFGDGLLKAERTYMADTEVPGPVSMTTAGSRTIYANGRTIYISDPGFPASILGDNTFQVPCQRPIVAVASHVDTLLIWTESETFAYRVPASGDVVSGGALFQLSDGIGCLGHQAVAVGPEAIFWVSSRGVHMIGSQLSIETISAPIRRFFDGDETNPLTNYFTMLDHGQSQVRSQQPAIRYHFDPWLVHLTWSRTEDILVASFPRQKLALVRSLNDWSYWSFETPVYEGADDDPINVFIQPGGPPPPPGASARVGVTNNIANPVLVATDRDLYLVGGPHAEAMADALTLHSIASVPAARHTTARSYFVLQYGRGGGVDRSVADESSRKIAGQYFPVVDVPSWAGLAIFERFIPVELGFKYPGSALTGEAGDIWVPLVIMPGRDETIVTAKAQAINLIVNFDRAMWTPIYRTGTSEVSFVVPEERSASRAGWGIGAPAAGTQVRVFNNVGAADPAGRELRIQWTGLGAGAWNNEPDLMNLLPGKNNRILYLPFRRVDGAASSVSGVGIRLGPGALPSVTVAAAALNLGVLTWEQWSVASNIEHHSVEGSVDPLAQPVSYAYMGIPVGLRGTERAMARGITASVTTSGVGKVANRKFDDWPFGLFNVLGAADGAEWMVQVVDAANPDGRDAALRLTRNSPTLRTRIKNATGDLTEAVFDGAARYGDRINFSLPTSGAVLIGDTQRTDVHVSDMVRGSSFVWMIHGHVHDKAERMTFHRIQAIVRGLSPRGRR